MQDWYQELIPADKNFVLVDTPKKFSTMARYLDDAKLAAFDCETTGLNTRHDRIIGMGFATSFTNAFYVPTLNGMGDPYWENSAIMGWMNKWLRNENIKKVLHNGKYDRKMLRSRGIDIGGFTFDTLLADFLLDENLPHKLEFCGKRELPENHSNAHIRISEIVHKLGINNAAKTAKGMLRVPIELMKNYGCLDVTTCWKLAQLYEPRLEQENLDRLFYMLIMPLQEVLMEMEERGVKIDVDKLRKLRDDEPIFLQLEKQIFEITEKRLNLNSPEQISELLYDKLKLPIQSDKDGKRTTDDKSLIKLLDAHPVVDLIRQYRSSFKIYTSYVLGLSDLLDNGRLYTNYLVHGARTGRLASADPNLQNIPVKTDQGKQIRACFIPDDGCSLGPFDYSQIELRVLACYSRDPILLDAYFTGKDIHQKTASVAFQIPLESVQNERQAGKTLNFGIIYGMAEHGLVNALKGHWKPGNEYLQAKEFIQRYFDEYKGVDALVKKVHSDLEVTHEVVNMFGRKRRFPNIQTATGGLKRYLLRQSFNAYIQGTASDITSLGLIRVNNMLKKEGYATRPILDVHDEIIFNIPENEKEVCEKIAKIMIEPVGTMDVPLEVDYKLHDCWRK